MHDPQKGIIADGQHQPPGEVGRGTPAESETEMTNQHLEPRCPARPRPEQPLSEAFREDPSLTMGYRADKAPSGDAQFQAPTATGQI